VLREEKKEGGNLTRESRPRANRKLFRCTRRVSRNRVGSGRTAKNDKLILVGHITHNLQTGRGPVKAKTEEPTVGREPKKETNQDWFIGCRKVTFVEETYGRRRSGSTRDAIRKGRGSDSGRS